MARIRVLDRTEVATSLVKEGLPRGFALEVAKLYVETSPEAALKKLISRGYCGIDKEDYENEDQKKSNN